MAQGPSGWLSLLRPTSGQSAPSPTVVVLGMTGDGKSNLCTWLLGNPDLFKVSDLAESCTDVPVSQTGKCFGGLAQYRGRWTVVDTPGLSDSAGRDAQNLKDTVGLLKEHVKDVNAFILVVNAQQDRMSSALKNTIKVFRGCFGSRWWNNLCVVFTKWDWDKRLGGFTADKLRRRKAEWTAWFRQCEEEYSGLDRVVDGAEIQFFGVDIPSLALVQQEFGPDEVNDILNKGNKDGIPCTGDQLRQLYNHIYVVLAAKPAMSMQLAEAKVDDLHEEIARRLREEEERRAEQEEAHKRQLQEERDRRQAEQAAAKAKEEMLAREARETEERLRREARERQEQRDREHRAELERAQREAEAAWRRAQEALSWQSSPRCSPSMPISSSRSSSSPKMQWNDFQHSHKGQGYNSTQMAAMYKSYKEG